MVNYSLQQDPMSAIFGSLADPTRRDILRRVAKAELTIGDIARYYDMSLAAISKHLKILEKAKLIIKRRQGKQQLVTMAPATVDEAMQFLDQYKKQWEDRLDSLESYLKTIQS